MNLIEKAIQTGSVPRAARPRRRGVALLAVAAAVLAAGAAPGPPPIQSRSVIVTDSVCGAEGARHDDHRRCVLERVSEGERIVLYDPKRDALYEIRYASDELRIKVLNDLAGFRIVARGRWDDQRHVVALSGASLARTPLPPEAIEPVD